MSFLDRVIYIKRIQDEARRYELDGIARVAAWDRNVKAYVEQGETRAEAQDRAFREALAQMRAIGMDKKGDP